MLRISLLVGLVYVSQFVLAPSLGASGDHITYQSSGKSLLLGLPSLDEASLNELNSLQASGTVTSVDLVHAYIQRIYEVNSLLRAVSEINPDALLIAGSLDAERAAGRVRGPLHGIPILVKDNIATKDLMNNTAGSYALVGATVSHEATVVAKLRTAGAVILGKATMGEWAQMRSRCASSSHGWSAYGGQPLGAYHPGQDPSGSSSGSAIAASVGLALGALATETSGSIVLPAEHNNLVGIKPTLGLTSRDMVIPISLRQDTVGPVARTVKDAAYILTAISGKDKSDIWTDAQPFEEVPDYVKACEYEAFRGSRLGIPRNGIRAFLNKTSEPIMAAFETAVNLIRGAGADVVDEANFASFNVDSFSRNSTIVLDTDFVAHLTNYLSQLVENPNNVHNLQDILAYTRNDPREEHHDRDTYVWDRGLERNYTNESEESFNAYQANLEMAGPLGVLGTLDRYNLDALVMPTFASFHLPAIAGLPVITVPLGSFPADTAVEMNLKGTLVNVAPNIPFGIAFVGRKWSEETLIGLAYAFEQRTMARLKVKPYIRPTFDLQDQIYPPGGAEAAFPIQPTQLGNPCATLSETVQATIKYSLRGVFAIAHWTLALFGSIASTI